MITLSSQLATELGLTYWQLVKENTTTMPQLNHQEKELLRKILQAKAVDLKKCTIEVVKNGIALVITQTHHLHFDDVKQADTDKVIHLAKLADMLEDKELKKLTWYKLKELNFY